MNTSNQKLLKGIRIFFKGLFIFIIIIGGINIISHITMLVFKGEGPPNYLAATFIIKNPSGLVAHDQSQAEIQEVFGIGAAVVKGVPVSLKVVNAAYTFILFFIYLIAIQVIRRILKSVNENNLFSLTNGKRLRNIGFLLLLSILLDNSLMIINSVNLFSFPMTSLAGLIGALVGNATAQIVGVVFVFLMAAIFRIGVSMQEENQSFV